MRDSESTEIESRTYRMESRRKLAATAESDCAATLPAEIASAIATHAISRGRGWLGIPARRPSRRAHYTRTFRPRIDLSSLAAVSMLVALGAAHYHGGKSIGL